MLKSKRVDENTGYSEIILFHPIPTLHLLSASREQNSMDGGPGAHKSTEKGKRDESRTVSQAPPFPRLLSGKGSAPLQAG